MPSRRDGPLRRAAASVALLGLAWGCHAPPAPPPEPDPEPVLPLPVYQQELPDEEFASWLGSRHEHVREQEIALGWKAGPGGLAVTVELFGSPRPEVARAAERAFWQLVHHFAAPEERRQRPEIAAELRRLLAEDPPPATARILLDALGVAGDGLFDVRAAAAALEEPASFGAALRALERMPHPAAEQALVEQLREESPSSARAVAITRSLGVRRSDLAAPQWLASLEQNPAARGALARSGSPLAEELFRELAGPDCSGLEGADVLRYAQRLLERSRPQTATELLLAMSGHAAPHLRASALRGLAEARGEGAAAAVLAGLEDPAPAVRAAARDGLAVWPGTPIERSLRQATRQGDDPLRAELLRVQVARAGDGAEGLLASALESWGLQERLAALELASREGGPSLEPALRQILERGSEAERPLAEDALLAWAEGLVERGENARALELFLDLAESGRQATALRGLTGVRRIPDASAWERVAALRRRPGLGEAAALAEIRIAATMAAADPERAAAKLDELVMSSTSRAVRTEAAAELRALGVDTRDYARRAGFLIGWQLYRSEALDARPFEEHPFAISGPVLEARPERWRQVETEDLDGVLDFLPLFDETSDRAVYAYLRFDWPSAEGALLKLGSDDGVAVWFNDELVHANPVMRGLSVDADTVPVELVAGENELLIKVTQGGGDWRMCARLTDLSGAPVDWSKRSEPR